MPNNLNGINTILKPTFNTKPTPENIKLKTGLKTGQQKIKKTITKTIDNNNISSCKRVSIKLKELVPSITVFGVTIFATTPKLYL